MKAADQTVPHNTQNSVEKEDAAVPLAPSIAGLSAGIKAAEQQDAPLPSSPARRAGTDIPSVPEGPTRAAGAAPQQAALKPLMTQAQLRTAANAARAEIKAAAAGKGPAAAAAKQQAAPPAKAAPMRIPFKDALTGGGAAAAAAAAGASLQPARSNVYSRAQQVDEYFGQPAYTPAQLRDAAVLDLVLEHLSMLKEVLQHLLHNVDERSLTTHSTILPGLIRAGAGMVAADPTSRLVGWLLCHGKELLQREAWAAEKWERSTCALAHELEVELVAELARIRERKAGITANAPISAPRAAPSGARPAIKPSSRFKTKPVTMPKHPIHDPALDDNIINDCATEDAALLSAMARRGREPPSHHDDKALVRQIS